MKFLADDNKGGNPQAGGAVVPTTAVRDRDGKKVVFIVLNGKAHEARVKILAQRSGGYLVDGPNGGENVISSRAGQSERRRQNQD